MFLLAPFGVPYAMTSLSSPNTQLQQKPPGAPTFARAMYPFTPSNVTKLVLRGNKGTVIAAVDPRKGAEVEPRGAVVSESRKGASDVDPETAGGDRISLWSR